MQKTMEGGAKKERKKEEEEEARKRRYQKTRVSPKKKEKKPGREREEAKGETKGAAFLLPQGLTLRLGSSPSPALVCFCESLRERGVRDGGEWRKDARKRETEARRGERLLFFRPSSPLFSLGKKRNRHPPPSGAQAQLFSAPLLPSTVLSAHHRRPSPRARAPGIDRPGLAPPPAAELDDSPEGALANSPPPPPHVSPPDRSSTTVVNPRGCWLGRFQGAIFPPGAVGLIVAILNRDFDEGKSGVRKRREERGKAFSLCPESDKQFFFSTTESARLKENFFYSDY